MKKFFSFFIVQFKYFFLNPFWKSWIILIILFLTIGSNALIWYLYLHFYHNIVSLISIVFSSSVLVLNLLLANIIYPKKDLPAYFFLSASLIIQIFIIYFLKIAYLSGAF